MDGIQRTPWREGVRAVAIGVVLIALGHDLLALLAQTAIWPADFASYYVPARAAISFPGVNVYDYGGLLRLNATQQYVTGPFYPYIYPPFALLALRPLAALPWSVASTLWAVCSHACAIGSAWLLATSFTLVLRRGASAEGADARIRAVHQFLSSTELRLGAYAFPLVPFAVAASVFLLSWPTCDTYYWGQINFVVVFLLLIAFYADLSGHPVVAGAAVALAGGLKLTPLIFLGYFAIRGAWKALAVGAIGAGLVFATPLLFFPAQDYDHLRVELTLLDSMFVLGDHNESFIAIFPHVAALLGHGSAATLTRAETLGEAVAGLIGLITVIALGAARWLRPRSREGAGENVLSVAAVFAPTVWLSFALTLAAYELVTPLVWSHFYVVAMPCTVMLAAYPLLAPRALSTRLQTVTILVGGVGIALLTCELPFGADRGSLGSPGPWALFLLNLRPLALGLVWLLALTPLLQTAISNYRGGRAVAAAETLGEVSADTDLEYDHAARALPQQH